MQIRYGCSSAREAVMIRGRMEQSNGLDHTKSYKELKMKEREKRTIVLNPADRSSCSM